MVSNRKSERTIHVDEGVGRYRCPSAVTRTFPRSTRSTSECCSNLGYRRLTSLSRPSPANMRVRPGSRDGPRLHARRTSTWNMEPSKVAEPIPALFSELKPVSLSTTLQRPNRDKVRVGEQFTNDKPSTWFENTTQFL
jgi:hypothetical protein